jgi:hypothetical protein
MMIPVWRPIRSTIRGLWASFTHGSVSITGVAKQWSTYVAKQSRSWVGRR